ncbi:uncharacterized protein LOC121739363 [Aricia agestis]|uniref:uncharacterized protein LOC121739363 n=1 Tax=Aricia agestis TaxID=91739 RepID=UPI001C20704A|nr:uncharacterized protein LOC121739363 [Aricia agestis]
MMKLLVLITIQLCLSSCLILNVFHGPLISSLRVPNGHILHKRQAHPIIEHVWADDYYDQNNYAPIKPQLREIHSAPQPSKHNKKLNEEPNKIIGESQTLPPVHFSPEAYSNELPHFSPDNNLDISLDNPTINDIDLIDILNDLSDCVELNTVHTLRLCPYKRESHKANHFSRFKTLTDEELESRIEKKCRTVNAILKDSIKEIKDSVKKNKAIRDGNDLKNNANESLTLYSNRIPSNEKMVENLVSVSSHPNLKDSSNILEENNKKTEDVAEPNIKVTENINEKNYANEDKLILSTDKTEQLSLEKTNKTREDVIDQNTLNQASLSDYDTTAKNVDKIELQNALHDLFDPTKEVLSELDAQLQENDTLKNITDGIGDEKPEVENVQTDAEPLNDSNDSNIRNESKDNNVSKILEFVDGRRNFYRPRVNENEVPVIRIITHEYPDGNVVSKVNGTEVLINDSPSEDSYTNVFVKNINVQGNHNVTEVLYKFSIPKRIPENGELEPESHTLRNPNISFNGRLYLVHDTERIPAQFIQESNGNISIGLDILSVCETKHHDPSSVLFKILCNCKNCSSEKN